MHSNKINQKAKKIQNDKLEKKDQAHSDRNASNKPTWRICIMDSFASLINKTAQSRTMTSPSSSCTDRRYNWTTLNQRLLDDESLQSHSHSDIWILRENAASFWTAQFKPQGKLQYKLTIRVFFHIYFSNNAIIIKRRQVIWKYWVHLSSCFSIIELKNKYFKNHNKLLFFFIAKVCIPKCDSFIAKSIEESCC